MGEVRVRHKIYICIRLTSSTGTYLLLLLLLFLLPVTRPILPFAILPILALLQLLPSAI